MSVRIKDWNKFQHFKDRTPPWIKLYRDILDDPDWHDLDGDSAKVLVMLWLIASEDDSHNGILPDARRLAFRLRIKESELEQHLTKLSHYLIRDDINAISPRYQVDAPERAGEETETERERETEGETEGEADTCAGGRTHTREAQARTREETPRAARSAETRGTRLEAEWALPKAWGDWALVEKPGWTAEHVRQAADRFADYWHGLAGAKARKADWQATWRNWVRNETAGPGARASPRLTVAEQSQAAIAQWLGAASSGEMFEGQAERVDA